MQQLIKFKKQLKKQDSKKLRQFLTNYPKQQSPMDISITTMRKNLNMFQTAVNHHFPMDLSKESIVKSKHLNGSVTDSKIRTFFMPEFS